MVFTARDVLLPEHLHAWQACRMTSSPLQLSERGLFVPFWGAFCTFLCHFLPFSDFNSVAINRARARCVCKQPPHSPSRCAIDNPAGLSTAPRLQLRFGDGTPAHVSHIHSLLSR